jgi:hypothetical protein
MSSSQVATMRPADLSAASSVTPTRTPVPRARDVASTTTSLRQLPPETAAGALPEPS